jgi:hypothetical protein
LSQGKNIVRKVHGFVIFFAEESRMGRETPATMLTLLIAIGLSFVGIQQGFAADEPAASGKLVLKEGSEVKLKFADNLSSKTATEGDPVNLILDEDIKIGDAIVAKAGCKAVGTITNSKKAGMMGKAGELNMRIEHLTVGDERVKLRGSKGKEGQGKEGTAVALTVLFGPIGLIKHGKNVEVKAGTPLTAYVDNDVALPPAK